MLIRFKRIFIIPFCFLLAFFLASSIQAVDEISGIKLQVQNDEIQIVTDGDASTYYLEYCTPGGTWQKWNADVQIANADSLWFRAVFESGDVMMYEPPADVNTFYSPAASLNTSADGLSVTTIGSFSEDGSLQALAAPDVMSLESYSSPAYMMDVPDPANNQAYATPDPGTTRLYWHNQSSGLVSIWHLSQESMRKSYVTVFDTNLPAAWDIAGVADINSDGIDDIIWHNQVGGRVVVWFLAADGVLDASQSVFENALTTGWVVATLKDADGDGTPDIIWRNEKTNRLVIWFLNADGEQVGSLDVHDTNLPLDWLFSGCEDIDSDGSLDIVWRNRNTNRVVVWFLSTDGTYASYLQVHDKNLPTDWEIVGLTDVDTDGTPDIIWRNKRTNRLVVWFLTATGTMREWLTIYDSNLPLDWSMDGIADVNVDGTPDIIWRNQKTNRVVAWFLSPTDWTRTSDATVSDSNPPISWLLSAISE